MLLASITPCAAFGQVVVLSADRASVVADVRMTDAKVELLDPGGQLKESIPASEVWRIGFEVLPRHDKPASWLCTRDGRRLRGQALTLDMTQARLTASAGEVISLPREDLEAVFFQARLPAYEPPDYGVRIISATGDVLDAPAIELTDDGVLVDAGPDVEPIVLARDRVAGVVWSTGEAEGVADADKTGRSILDLRSGERLIGVLSAIDANQVRVESPGGERTVPRREVRSIARPGLKRIPAENRLPQVPRDKSGRLPAIRAKANGLGNPIRLGWRVYRHGIGLRAPAEATLSVPKDARWFTGRFGVDRDAPADVQVNWAILVDGKMAIEGKEARRDEAATVFAVDVKGAKSIVLEAKPAAHDAAGCLGDFADVMFVCP
jgi:hypothetical protein